MLKNYFNSEDEEMLENTATNDTGASQTTIDDQVQAPMSSSIDSGEVTSDSTKTDINVLTEATMFKIDPMINMGEITPYDFIKKH
ncbi:hypothetical protein ACVNP1_09465 [Staphylococcus aureus]